MRSRALFLSHASPDVGVARALREVLRGRGYRCWLASDDIVGDDWPAQIASAVAASDALIVLLSEAANRSAHVAREVTLAVQKERPVIPIRLEEVEPEGSLTYLLALAQWVDVYPGPVDAHAEGVVAHIEALLDAPKQAVGGGTGAPVPRRAPPPVALTSFVGREQELAEVAGYLTGARLVTLTGAGGCGKTRLAMEAASRVGGEHDGVAWAELSGVDTPDLVVPVVARSVGISEERGRPLLDQVVDGINRAPLLLVMDNCEHLIDRVAEVASVLLARCPELRVLATSRLALGVPGEVAYRVPPLACPQRDSTRDRVEALRYDAVRLFAERAELARSSFRLTSEELGAVVEVCIQLDGIPLAIELAAARLAMLSVDELASRLEDRFSILRGGSRTALPRHRTLEATIDWSYQLLTRREQQIFSRLAVFNEGFTLDAAEQVCSADGIEPRDVGELVGSLIDQSLLVREEDAGGSRYRQLETIRAFAADRLAEDGSTELVAVRHAAFFSDLAGRAAEQLGGPEQEEWLRRLEADHGNLRAALRWLTDRDDLEAAARFAVALRRFWLTRGHWREGLDQLSALLQRGTGLPDDVVAEALHSAGQFAFRLGEYDRAVANYRRSLECYERIDDPVGIGQASVGLGAIMLDRGDLDEAQRLAKHAAATAESAGDGETLARALNTLALVARHRGDLDRSRQLLHRALEVGRRIGDSRRMCIIMNNLGDNALHRGDLDEAETFLVSALQAARSLGDFSMQGMAHENLGWLALLRGDHGLSAEHLRRGLDLDVGLGDPYAVMSTLDKYSALAAETGTPHRAAVMLGAAQALAREMRLSYPDDLPVAQRIGSLEVDLGPAEFSRLVQMGAAMDLDAAIAYARADAPPADPT